MSCACVNERSCYSAEVSDKGAATKTMILDEALQLASVIGFNALSIGALAGRTGMSKSGLFAHFKSKVELQLQTLAQARRQFEFVVIEPSFNAPRGRQRLMELFERWLTWEADALEGGCIFVGSAAELDDQPGPMRDALVQDLRRWHGILAQEARNAIDNGEAPRHTDPLELAFLIQALMLGYHYESRVLGIDGAADRAAKAFGAIFDA
jgi:AcrR family transcriptional regulator